jgi:hypothetical protein
MSWRQLEALRDRVRMKDELPVTAIAFFFDDARVEVGNKFSFMGMYGSDVVLTEPGVPFDRLAVFLHMRWPLGLEVGAFKFRIEIPRQEPISHEIEPASTEPYRSSIITPFAGMQLNAILNLRFPPLQPGDDIKVWAIVDDNDLPAGRLVVRAASDARPAGPTQ